MNHVDVSLPVVLDDMIDNTDLELNGPGGLELSILRNL